MKKKILFVITKSFWGGAQVYVYNLAVSLAEEGFDVVVALGGEGDLKKKLKEKKIRVITVPNLVRDVSIKNEFKVFLNLIKIFRKEKPDIVHLNSSKIGGLGSFAGRIARVKKIVFTAHGWAFNEDRSWKQKFAIKFLSWVTVIFSHRTITIAKKERKQMIRYPFVSKKIFTIYNAIPFVDFIGKKEAREKLLGEQKDDFLWIGTIAELHKNKGLKYAIQAMDLLKQNGTNAVFVVISEGEEKEKLEKLIKEKDLSDRVFLVGRYDNAVKLLKAFDIFLLPSIKEGFPYTLLEAGLAELPVITTGVGGIPEIIENMKTGMIVRSKDPKDIYFAILYLLANIEKMEQFKKNLHKKVKENFELKRMVEETKNLYFS
ncbi:glycosyltransferase [Patescibacteria group bacterium]|nr:glycosyltransferase [Patescibacteria group bacterium]MCG2694502.1 glycosyltransferase [Candidatus Parcubacteria bacterium]